MQKILTKILTDKSARSDEKVLTATAQANLLPWATLED
jgi:hypothetical protein